MRFSQDLSPPILRFLRALVGTLISAIMLTACTVIVNYPAPERSLEGLTRKSDQVVVGMVAGTVGHEMDWGTADQDPAGSGLGLPVAYHEVTVTETLKGEELSTLVVAVLHPLAVRGISPAGREAVLLQGQQVLLFLEKLTNQEVPSLDLYESFFVPVRENNGVFDIGMDGTVVPRISDVFSNSDFTLAEVRSRVANTEVESETEESGAETFSVPDRPQPILELCKGDRCPYLD